MNPIFWGLIDVLILTEGGFIQRIIPPVSPLLLGSLFIGNFTFVTSSRWQPAAR